MVDDEINENEVKFSLAYSLDKDKFFRRMCPSCGREFKTQVDEADIVASLQPTFKRIGSEIGQDLSVQGDESQSTYLYCPYCNHYDQASEMLTIVFSNYLKRLVMRDYVMPMLDNSFSDIANNFNKNKSKSSGGLFDIKVAFEHTKSIYPPRPIHGPEPPDMITVELLCCHKKIKISEGWHLLEKCPYCGTDVFLCS